jgi:putative membrane protein
MAGMVVPLHWHNEPLLLLCLLGAGWVYALGIGPFRSKIAPPGTPYPVGRAVAFYAGLIINYLAVGSPLDQFGEDYLFSVHMVQHLIIVYVTPPLMLWGLPWWLVDAALARPWVKRLARPFLHPAVCCMSFVLVFALWHLPELYESALRSRPIHILEHATIFFTALQMWWVFMGPSKVFPPCNYPVRILCAFVLTAAHMPILGLLTFSDDPLYRTYELAPRIIPSLDAKQDQVLGGAIMEMTAALVSVGLLGWSIGGWMRDDERRQTRPKLLSRPLPEVKSD